jgi:ATP-grasp domain
MSTTRAAILNAGGGSWAFDEIAGRLARAMGLEVSATPAYANYLLGWDGPRAPVGRCFVPYPAIRVASDKRRLAESFAHHQVATPRTHLLHSEAEVQSLLQAGAPCRWVLKWPTGCGGAGHRLLEPGASLPSGWPLPYVVQEFILLEVPEVYRLYCVAGETFGWNVRRFGPGTAASPFVAHARGARYEEAGDVPPEAREQARRALSATGLLDSFGCVDLLRDGRGAMAGAGGEHGRGFQPCGSRHRRRGHRRGDRPPAVPGVRAMGRNVRGRDQRRGWLERLTLELCPLVKATGRFRKRRGA